MRTPVRGRVEALLVADGDSVHRGQIVALLESSAQRNAVERLRRTVRQRVLEHQMSRRAAEFDQIRSWEQAVQARVELAQARSMLLTTLVDFGDPRPIDSVLVDPNALPVRIESARGAVVAAASRLRSALNDSGRFALQRDEEVRQSLELASLQAEVQEQEDQLRRLTLRAATSGVVMGSRLDGLLGAMVDEGDILLSVASRSKWEVRTYVREQDVPAIRIGQSVTLEIPWESTVQARPLRGQVIAVATAPMVRSDQRAGLELENPADPRYLVRIALRTPPRSGSGETLAPGSSMRAHIVGRRRSLARVILDQLGGR
ncbi:HlyD family secretion protein [Gemmatimonas sp. UBA7669]|uniref:HlyD family secretion protein n=1 Tax=Gemmatimonas sp. UBA7669 TaxID=1946568 RepID=UPI0039C860A5